MNISGILLLLCTAYAEDISKIVSGSKICREDFGTSGKVDDEIYNSCVYKIHGSSIGGGAEAGEKIRLRIHEFSSHDHDCLDQAIG